MARSAKANAVDDTADIDVELVTTAPDEWEWETVIDRVPTKVMFDTIGDSFVGQYVERRTVTPDNFVPATAEKPAQNEPFDLLIFTARDGNPYAVNTSYKLDAGMEKVKVGDWCRITYVADIETGRKQNPMKDLMVEVRKS